MESFHEQTIKFRECLQHTDELGSLKANIEKEIFHLVQYHIRQLELQQTAPNYSGNIVTAIAQISEVNADISAFSFAKYLVSWTGCRPFNDQGAKEIKHTRISRASACLKPLLVRVANDPSNTYRARNGVTELRHAAGKSNHLRGQNVPSEISCFG